MKRAMSRASFEFSGRSRFITSALFAGCCLGFAGCTGASSDTEEWTNPATASTADESKSFHGPFLSEPVSVTLNKLPKHAWVTVRFKLLVIGTWDGSSPVWGPDLWSLRVRGGPQLMLTSFCNMGGFINNREQAFPDNFPWAIHPAWTGATPLGAKYFPRPGEKPVRGDAIYPVEVVFPHVGDALTLDLSGIYNDPTDRNQKWGVANLEWSTSEAAVPVDEVELYRLWDELASPDAVRANAALRKFVSTGDAGVDFLTRRIDALVAQRNSDESAAPGVGAPEALRLRRAEVILRIAAGARTGRARFALEHLYPEYRL